MNASIPPEWKKTGPTAGLGISSVLRHVIDCQLLLNTLQATYPLERPANWHLIPLMTDSINN